MAEGSALEQRVCLDGKFFRVGDERFFVRGVSYGGFAPNHAGEPFPEREQIARDFEMMRDLGVNTVRVYDIPPRWFLDVAAERALRVFVTVPWNVQSCFLDTRNSRRQVRTAVVSSVQALAGHPALFAFALANEIPPDIVRWSGAARVEAFLDELTSAARDAAPDELFTYSNYPPTEFLQPREIDFLTFNVFLHERDALADYLARLQHLADAKPLLLGECGVDALREGQERQAEILSWTIDVTFASGLAGAVVFSFTDDWYRGGRVVSDWAMGLTTAEREPKPAFAAVRSAFATAVPRPLPAAPKVSVVVATYNAGATLRACLDALLRINYPHYEIIVVDDGSTDDTPEVTTQYTSVRTLRVRENLGLSNARNLGIRAATGEIIAYTDADCRPDPDWLRYLVAGLVELPVVGIGGPNLLPPDDPPMAALIMMAPGGPTHVMLDDRFAEHIPGCNMAFWKWALEAVGGFDPIFHQAGDDVDICWRLQRRGWRLGFAPAGFVWHHRRSTLAGYFSQQAGYGAAEALLITRHPNQFSPLGGARWQGRIYNAAPFAFSWQRPAIYRGRFATGMFQTIYSPAADGLLPMFTSLEYHLVMVLPLIILAFIFAWLWPVALLAGIIPPTLCVSAAWRTPLPRRRVPWWSRGMLALMIYAQPLVRGAARLAGRLGSPTSRVKDSGSLEAESRVYSHAGVRERVYWAPSWRERTEWITRIIAALERKGWPCQPDSGWDNFDLEVFGSRWCRISLVTAAEMTREGAQILRCRLQPHWMLSTRLVVWGLLAAELLTIGIMNVTWKGWWIPVVTLGLLVWFFRWQARILQCRLSVVLDEVAREWDLVSVNGPTSGASGNQRSAERGA